MFTHKSVPVIFEPPCIYPHTQTHTQGNKHYRPVAIIIIIIIIIIITNITGMNMYQNQ